MRRITKKDLENCFVHHFAGRELVASRCDQFVSLADAIQCHTCRGKEITTVEITSRATYFAATYQVSCNNGIITSYKRIW